MTAGTEFSRTQRRARLAIRPFAMGVVLMTAGACGGGDSAPPAEPPPPPALTSLTASPSTVSLLSGATAALTATPITAGAGVNVSYSYSTSAAQIATVSATGMIAAVSPGSANITIVASGTGVGYTPSTQQATVAVHVSAPPNAISALSVSPDSVVLFSGSTQ